MSKRICYTAIIGGIGDQLRPIPPAAITDTKFVAFLGQSNWQLKSPWLSQLPLTTLAHGRRTARYHKCVPHRFFGGCEYSLWLDGTIGLNCPLSELIDTYLNGYDLCVFKHCQRSTVRAELDACIKLRKDDPLVMRPQVEGYLREGFPDTRLGETGAVLRRHTPDVEAFNEFWWQQLEAGSYRDQLSFNYACHTRGLEYNTFAGTMRNSPHFTWRAHQ